VGEKGGGRRTVNSRGEERDRVCHRKTASSLEAGRPNKGEWASIYPSRRPGKSSEALLREEGELWPFRARIKERPGSLKE